MAHSGGWVPALHSAPLHIHTLERTTVALVGFLVPRTLVWTSHRSYSSLLITYSLFNNTPEARNYVPVLKHFYSKCDRLWLTTRLYVTSYASNSWNMLRLVTGYTSHDRLHFTWQVTLDVTYPGGGSPPPLTASGSRTSRRCTPRSYRLCPQSSPRTWTRAAGGESVQSVQVT